jgi:carbamoyl-phosphate synthase small subunit
MPQARAATIDNDQYSSGWCPRAVTAVLVLEDGTVLEGQGLGAEGDAVGEVCFNTAITGYQEILTDPSYAGQIITFTFPHVGNIGTNDEDIETSSPAAASGVRGAVMRANVTKASNYRSDKTLDKWLEQRNIITISGIDTRALTTHIRNSGYINAVIAHNADGVFDLDALKQKAKSWAGLVGTDMVPDVSTTQQFTSTQTGWQWDKGFGQLEDPKYHVVAVDYGLKRTILRCLANVGCKVTVVPAKTTAEEVLAHNPDGIFLANGPGDPEATGVYAVPEIKKMIASNIPMFGICLGHQMLALALGAATKKMHQGHHGANHPVKDHTTGKVEITSMNHGFAVDGQSLPTGITETHVSLFDGSNCGLAVDGKPIFSVQYHPEASPGPQDSHYLFERFAKMMDEAKG